MKCHFDAFNKLDSKSNQSKKIYSTYMCCLDVIHLLGICIYWWCVCVCVCYISGRWVLRIWTSATYLDGEWYISGRLLHSWTMEVTYLDDCYILISGSYISARHTAQVRTKKYCTRCPLGFSDTYYRWNKLWYAKDSTTIYLVHNTKFNN